MDYSTNSIRILVEVDWLIQSNGFLGTAKKWALDGLTT